MYRAVVINTQRGNVLLGWETLWGSEAIVPGGQKNNFPRQYGHPMAYHVLCAICQIAMIIQQIYLFFPLKGGGFADLTVYYLLSILESRPKTIGRGPAQVGATATIADGFNRPFVTARIAIVAACPPPMTTKSFSDFIMENY